MMKSWKKMMLALAALLAAAGCGQSENNTQKSKKADNTLQLDKEEPVKNIKPVEGVEEIVSPENLKAFAVANPTEGNKVFGAVTFTKVPEGVLIVADIGGLTPGKHGFHIHEHGDCSAADGSSAGGHFNPTDQKHGGPNSVERHVGDLGNLEANQHGFAHYNRVDRVISLDGEYSIIGKSIVIHAGEDDLESQPSGNSGSRIACGAIQKAALQ